MNSDEMLAKRLDLMVNGIIAASEVADATLIDMIDDNAPRQSVVALAAKLPTKVARALTKILTEARAANYRRGFLFIGGPGPFEGLPATGSWEEDAARLRRICDALLPVADAVEKEPQSTPAR